MDVDERYVGSSPTFATMTQQQLNDLIDLIAESIDKKLRYCTMVNHLGIKEYDSTLKYNGVEFTVKEYMTNDVVTGRRLNRIIIETPRYLYEDMYVQVAYEESYSRTIDIENRGRACYELAKKFVTEVLPKVDFELEKAVYNRTIDQILSVLD